jgi:putative ABC transport system ATP-binding protein
MEPIVHLRGVTKTYAMGDAAVNALRGVDLAIAAGEFVGVMGPSGSGKTTLMDIVGCLSRPSAGVYEFEGRRVDRLDDTALARVRGERIGFVFQTFNLLPRLTAAENVELPLLYRRIPRARRRERALALLARVGLSARGRTGPASCRAASGSASRSPARS